MRFFRRLRFKLKHFFEADEPEEEEEISLKTLSIIFLLGLFVLFGSYFVFSEGRNTLTGYLQVLAIGEIKNIGNSYTTTNCRDCKVYAKFGLEQDKKVLLIDYELSHKCGTWRQIHKVFEKIFKIPVDFGWVQINKRIDNENWSHYTTISLIVKGTGEPSNLEFSIVEEDGDAWYYFDKTSLASKDWIEIKAPFEEFINPGWASHGDGKRELKNMISIQITITNFDKPLKNNLLFEIFDGEIFDLS